MNGSCAGHYATSWDAKMSKTSSLPIIIIIIIEQSKGYVRDMR